MAGSSKLYDKKRGVIQYHNVALQDLDASSNLPVTIMGGMYNASGVTITDGKPCAFQFTSDGKLMVDTEFTLEATGVVINNIKVFSPDNTAVNSVYGKTDSNQYAYARITDGTTAGTITTGTINGLNVVISDGTTVPGVLTGTTKTLASSIHDGTNLLTLLTGTLKTMPVTLHDGTTAQSIIATIGSAKEDISSVGGEVIVADNAVGSGTTKPVPTGGKYNSTPPTYTDGDVVMDQYDVNGNHKMTAAADIPTALTGGSKTVTTPGTAEALGTTLSARSIYIRAKGANTSFVCVGDSNVDESSNQQIVLYANDSITMDISDRATVYVDVDVGSEGVDYLVMS